ncbi:MAG: DNA gyrase inhibitor YacG [Desulfuromonadales bacterium]|nr:DNA gyrase inhibitor YacG [Desulfuromonadales bacterium]
MAITGLNCPQCHRPTVWEGNDFRPFCSERCRLIDLGDWVDGSYRIPASDTSVGNDQDIDNNENG